MILKYGDFYCDIGRKQAEGENEKGITDQERQPKLGRSSAPRRGRFKVGDGLRSDGMNHRY